MASYVEEQSEELEALRAIYGEEFTEIVSDPPCFMIHLTNLEVDLSGSVHLKIEFPVTYPSVVPCIDIPMRSNILSKTQCEELTSYLHKQAEENIGMAMVFTLVESAQDWINENVRAVPPDALIEDEKTTEELKPAVTASPVKISYDAKIQGGKWDYVLGLVGKPSAGKSTFFNASTHLNLAKVGAHPFTTIEPNIGKAFYSIPCPCHQFHIENCNAAYGHNDKGERLMPLLLKDVAGLVPGAWEGKGRGNRFMNDLLDADVLVHVLDVSGETNEKGETTTDYDPSLDVTWVQHELHQWIHQNVMSKWETIIRRPQKLVDMFTGYHASKAVIFQAFKQAGISEKELALLPQWEDEVLHRIVKEFLNVRFPMLLVLNKCDKTASEKHIQRIMDLYPDLPCIPVSSEAESFLQAQTKTGSVIVDIKTNNVQTTEKADSAVKLKVQDIQSQVLHRYGSTNVHEALCKAVSLKPPQYAYPVGCLDTLRSVKRAGVTGSREVSCLKDCISLKPDTTVEELYNVLKRHPVDLLSGDFVRAETVDNCGSKRPVKKDEKITESIQILKLMTTKRVT